MHWSSEGRTTLLVLQFLHVRSMLKPWSLHDCCNPKIMIYALKSTTMIHCFHVTMYVYLSPCAVYKYTYIYNIYSIHQRALGHIRRISGWVGSEIPKTQRSLYWIRVCPRMGTPVHPRNGNLNGDSHDQQLDLGFSLQSFRHFHIVFVAPLIEHHDGWKPTWPKCLAQVLHSVAGEEVSDEAWNGKVCMSLPEVI